MTTLTEDPGAMLTPYLDDLPAVFDSAEKLAEVIDRVERLARAHVPDVSTNTGRLAIASIAAKVARSKTALDDAGKRKTEDLRRAKEVVDAQRRNIRERFDELKTEVRAPLTEWEDAEEARKQALEERLDELAVRVAYDHSWSAVGIAEEIVRIENIPIDESWQEALASAATRKDATLFDLRLKLGAARQREAEAAELARLRAEAAEREHREAERIAAQIAEANQRNAKVDEDARQAAIALARADAARSARAQAEREAWEQIAAAERRAQEATERQRAAEAAAEQAAVEAEARQAAAVAAERERAEAQRQAAADAQAKRDANKRIRVAARKEMVASLEPIIAKVIGDDRNAVATNSDLHGAELVADALLAGAVPRCTVVL